MSEPGVSRIAFVGVCTMDTIASVQHYPGADSRTVVDDLLRAGGGPAATAAVTAARLGATATLVSAVGDDVDGRAILAGLEAEGVSTAAVQVVPGSASGASVVTLDLTEGTRTILNRPPPSLDLSHPLVHEAVAGAQWVHADQAGLAVFGAEAGGAAAAQRSYDGGNPVDGLDVSRLDLYAPTLEQLRAGFAEHSSPAELVRAARGAGAGRVVVTDGSRGAYALDHGSNAVAHVPASRGVVRSTLGAGDVFHGALVAALAAGQDLVTAVALANSVALASCAGPDGRSAIPRLDPCTITLDDLDLQGAISWL